MSIINSTYKLIQNSSDVFLKRLIGSSGMGECVQQLFLNRRPSFQIFFQFSQFSFKMIVAFSRQLYQKSKLPNFYFHQRLLIFRLRLYFWVLMIKRGLTQNIFETMNNASTQTIKKYPLTRVILQDNSSNNFCFVVTTTRIETISPKIRKFNLRFEINVVHKNGQFVTWPSIFSQHLQYNPSIVKPQILQSSLNFLFESDHLKFFYRYAIFFQRKAKQSIKDSRKSRVENQKKILQDRKLRQRDLRRKLIHQIELGIYKELEKHLQVITQHLSLIGFFCSLPTFKEMRKQRGMNGKILNQAMKLRNKNLQFGRDASILLSKLTKLKLVKTCGLDSEVGMEIVLDTRGKEQDRLRSTIQKELQGILHDIGQANRKRGKNLYIIQELNEEPCKLQIIGGVSAVQKRKIRSIRVSQESNPLNRYQMEVDNFWLGKKMLKEEKSNTNSTKRFERELDIIRRISESSAYRKFYLLDYYHYPGEKSLYYIDWQEHSLASYLSLFRPYLQVGELLSICIQMVLIVIDLHESGVVHRDLKPSNFMVDFSSKLPFPLLKLIDYSDSMLIDERSREEVASGSFKVYSTPSYCPLETSTFNQDYAKLGLINPKIDNWSLGIILFEVLNGYLPISYSTCTAKDIHALWKFQFMNQTHQQKQCNMGSVKNIIDVISYELIKIEQEERMDLNKALALLLLTKFHTENLKNVFKE